MSAACLQFLWAQTAVLSAVVLLLALLRPWLQRGLGAGAVYGCWCAVPLSLWAACLPHRSGPVWVLQPLEALAQVPQHAAAAWLPAASLGRAAAGLTLLWLLGFLMVVGAIAYRHHGFLRSLTRASDSYPHVHPHPQPQRAAWRAAAGTSPAQLGWWRSQLVLPLDFEQRFDNDEQRLIILHEQMHARRGDNVCNLLAALIAALHWFNPVAWWALHRVRMDQELACDAAVLNQHPDATRSYAAALLKSQGLQRNLSSVAQWQSRHPLVERVAMLKRHPLSAQRRAVGVAFAALLAALSAGAVYATQAAEIAQRVELRFEIQLGDRKYPPGRLITALGVPATVGVGDEGGARWEVQMTTTQLPNGQLQIVTTYRTGTPWVDLPSKHTQITTEGDPFSMTVSDPSAAASLNLQRVVRLISAAEVPQK